jgi:hypothetical protein
MAQGPLRGDPCVQPQKETAAKEFLGLVFRFGKENTEGQPVPGDSV